MIMSNFLVKEIWKDVKGYEGSYQVSNFVNVRSLDRKVTDSMGRTYFYQSQYLRPGVNRHGYAYVILSKDNKTKSKKVHRLVAETFITNLEEKPEVNHIDGNKTNNTINNLEWSTRSHNQSRAFKKGLNSNKGTRNSKSKFTDEQVKWIRRLKNKITQKKLAKFYEVHESTIQRIQSGFYWTHI